MSHRFANEGELLSKAGGKEFTIFLKNELLPSSFPIIENSYRVNRRTSETPSCLAISKRCLKLPPFFTGPFKAPSNAQPC